MGVFGRLQGWARRLKRDVLALWLAARDRRTPWQARAVAALVAAYALSPIDLIPDVIPVLGYLDDLILVPAGIFIAIRLIPAPLMRGFRAAAGALARRPVSRWGLAMVLALWAVGLAIALRWGMAVR
ncbi:YkvA family protein [Pseudoroseicyclus tamaricis]|uniref:DUF1232 domain-containing protein n=1 Tax=Pseudoroseicyclus tamaricis TaxID=2705421 RepID=A0A6B2JWQ5_9RHOB|nr:DUF1232 domain-containing protein [Pseudoroseicyclus tamaricis]NDV02648.1 DUF1232 domain-containing protein [Pseudoroseicyclus tamaricis]